MTVTVAVDYGELDKALEAVAYTIATAQEQAASSADAQEWLNDAWRKVVGARGLVDMAAAALELEDEHEARSEYERASRSAYARNPDR